MKLKTPKWAAAVCWCAIASAGLALGGCASSSDATSILNADPPEKMYADADSLMTRGKFQDAAKKFEDLDRSHPYSPEARRAMVLAAYAYRPQPLPVTPEQKRAFVHALQSQDSRFGYEASNHYFYVPTDLAEKVVNCRSIQEEWLAKKQ